MQSVKFQAIFSSVKDKKVNKMLNEDIISIIRKDDHRGSNDRTGISSVKEMNIHKNIRNNNNDDIILIHKCIICIYLI